LRLLGQGHPAGLARLLHPSVQRVPPGQSTLSVLVDPLRLLRRDHPEVLVDPLHQLRRDHLVDLAVLLHL
jgi:hypothetical protein